MSDLKLTERTILNILDSAAPRLIATGTLWSEVRLDLEVRFSTYNKALEALEEKGQVIIVEGEDRNKAKITAEGQARLAE